MVDVSASVFGHLEVEARGESFAQIDASASVTAGLEFGATGEPALLPGKYQPTLTTVPGEKTPTFEIDLYDESGDPFAYADIDQVLLTVIHRPTNVSVIEDAVMDFEDGSPPRASYSFNEGEAFSIKRSGAHTIFATVESGTESHSSPAYEDLAIRSGDTPGYQQLALSGGGIETGLEAREENKTATIAEFDSIEITTVDVGTADVDNLLATDLIASEAGIEGDLDVTGLLTVESSTTLQDTLDVTGATSLSSDLDVGGTLSFDQFDQFTSSNTLFIDIGQDNFAVRDTDSSGVSNLIWRDFADRALKLGASHSNIQFRGDNVDVNGLDLINAASFDATSIETGSLDASGDVTVGSLDSSGDVTVGDNIIYTSNNGSSSGFRPKEGMMYTQFGDYATIYAYSDSGNVGWRFRNPSGSGDYFRVDNDGGGFLRGDLELTGEVIGSAQEWDGYELHKNGSDSVGVINFKTS